MRPVSQIFKDDQDDRKDPTIGVDLKILQKVSDRDKKRRKEVELLLKKKLIKTGADFYKAAMIYHHTPGYGDGLKAPKSTLKNYKIALKLAQKSIDKKYEKAKWLFAAVTDRLLTNQGKPQKFGTQYRKKDQSSPWELLPVNPKTTDTERKKYNVPTLKQTQNRLKKLNRI